MPQGVSMLGGASMLLCIHEKEQKQILYNKDTSSSVEEMEDEFNDEESQQKNMLS